MTASGIAFAGSLRDRRLVKMNTEDAMDDISLLLITEKASYGLAPPRWRATLDQIRSLPEVHVRPAS